MVSGTYWALLAAQGVCIRWCRQGEGWQGWSRESAHRRARTILGMHTDSSTSSVARGGIRLQNPMEFAPPEMSWWPEEATDVCSWRLCLFFVIHSGKSFLISYFVWCYLFQSMSLWGSNARSYVRYAALQMLVGMSICQVMDILKQEGTSRLRREICQLAWLDDNTGSVGEHFPYLQHWRWYARGMYSHRRDSDPGVHWNATQRLF